MRRPRSQQHPSMAALLLALLAAASTLPLPARACTSLLVGGGATDDGSTYIARNVDHDWSNVAHEVAHVPARAQATYYRSNLNGFGTPLPAGGLAYWALPAQGSDTFESSGVNSAGVAISATETIYFKRAARDADPLLPNQGITEDSIPSVLLPQARSARQAIQILGRIIERQGAGEGFGVLAADRREVWYLENAGGHHWLAKRIPHTKFLVAANQGRFQGIDWSQYNISMLCSRGLTTFAKNESLWIPAQGPFSLFKAYMHNDWWDLVFNYARVRELQRVLAGHVGPYPDARGDTLPPPPPEFLAPTTKLKMIDVMTSMRWHYPGTTHDAYFKQNPKELWHPVAMLLTGTGHVTRIRPASASLPPGLRVIQYVALGTPAWVPYIPIYTGLAPSDLPPALVGARGRRPDSTTLWWKGRRLAALMFRNWPLIGPGVESSIKAFDQQVESVRRPGVEERYTTAWRQGKPAVARAELAAFTKRVTIDAGALLDRLITNAVKKLGLPALPSDDTLVTWLNTATGQYKLDNWG